MFALDTNTLIDYFKGMGRVGERLLAAEPSEVAIPAVVLYELELGGGDRERFAPDRLANRTDGYVDRGGRTGERGNPGHAQHPRVPPGARSAAGRLVLSGRPRCVESSSTGDSRNSQAAVAAPVL